MKKANYEEHRLWALENNIRTRDDWRIITKHKLFPKNFYKNIEGSFRQKGEWKNWSSFISAVHIKQDKFENEQALVRIYNFSRDYKNLELGRHDSIDIYNFLASIELIYFRKPPQLSLMSLLNSFNKKDYVNPSRLEKEKVNVRKVTHGFLENLSFKSKKDKEDFLELERIFLIFSNLLKYQRKYKTINIIEKKLEQFMDLNDLDSSYFNINDFYKNYPPCKIDKKSDNKFFKFFNERQKNFFEILKINQFNYFEELTASNPPYEVTNTSVIDLDEDFLERKLFQVSNEFFKKIEELTKNNEDTYAISIAYFFHIFIESNNPNLKWYKSANTVFEKGALIDFYEYCDDQIKNNPNNFKIESSQKFLNSEDIFLGNQCINILNEIRKDFSPNKNEFLRFLELPIFYNSIIFPALSYFIVVLKTLPNGKIILKKINESPDEEDFINNIAVLLWGLENQILELDPFEKEINGIDASVDLKFNDFNIKNGFMQFIGRQERLNQRKFKNKEVTHFKIWSLQSLPVLLNIGDLESLEVIENNNDNSEEYLQISKEIIGAPVNQFKFIYKVKDDSMVPDFDIGDYAIIEKIRLLDLEYGKYYLIKTKTGKSDDFNLRKIMKPGSLKEGYGLLKTLNKDWPEAEIKMNDIEVFGKVIKIIKDLK